MIEVASLTKRYGELAAIRDVSFTAAPGQILGFLGPNGAGKTTTMRIITGFLPATTGTVRVDGFDVFEQSAEVRRRIGYLPENPPLYNDMSVPSYLRFVAKLKGLRRGDVAVALERLDLTLRHPKLLVAFLVRHGKIGAEIEELVLDPLQLRVAHLDPGPAHDGVELVDGAVGAYERVELRDARAVAETRLAAVAAARVDPGQANRLVALFHHVSRA